MDKMSGFVLRSAKKRGCQLGLHIVIVQAVRVGL